MPSLKETISEFISLTEKKSALAVARESGIGKTTVYAVLSGQRTNLNLETLLKIEAYIQKQKHLKAA